MSNFKASRTEKPNRQGLLWEALCLKAFEVFIKQQKLPGVIISLS